MYKTILVPLDGSPRAELILPHVESLARAYNAEVILMHVIEPLHHGVEAVSPSIIEVIQNLRDNFQTYLVEQKEALAKKGISSRTIMIHGPVVEEIIKVANHEQADLIAMVSHGRTGLARVFYGSIAAGVLHRIDRPLLLVRSLDEG